LTGLSDAGGQSSESRPPKPARWAEVASYLETAPKVAVTAGAVAYLCGMIVVGTHLSRYGASTLGFFAPQYIAAGIWSLLFLGVVSAQALFSLAALAFVAQHVRKKEWFLALLLLIAAAVPVLVVNLTIDVLRLIDVVVDERFIVPAVIVVGGALLGVMADSLGKRLYPKCFDVVKADIAPGQLASVIQFLRIGTACGAFLVTFPFFLWAFAREAYPAIPARWGGGEFIGAQVILPANRSARLFAMLMPSDTGLAAMRGRLVFVTDNDLLLIPDGEATPVLLRRSDVVELVLNIPEFAFTRPRPTPPPSSPPQVRTDTGTPPVTR
jgi:hypothetical protein